ncbi:MAG TPA: hypothetical protein VMB21_10045 [Candidatus Limnocylindria bacterium]|nr:hypothetical protein [Candidatus Limnocylindria bacterium]
MSHDLWSTFAELIRLPFHHEELVWGIVPLYFGWGMNELTSGKATFKTAIQTGFALLWSGAHWAWQAFRDDPAKVVGLNTHGLFAVNSAVTLLVILLGALALWSGLRRRYPSGMKFLGHTRFSAYFMIAIFPIQSGYLEWSWLRVCAIAVFAVPLWLVLHFALIPVRK